jgi:tetratricopeptide (TPR) repeat protein
MLKRIDRWLFRYVLVAILFPQLAGCAGLQEPQAAEMLAFRDQTEHFVRATTQVFRKLVATREPVATLGKAVPTPEVVPEVDVSLIPTTHQTMFSEFVIRPTKHQVLPSYTIRLKPQAIAAAYAYRADQSVAANDQPNAIVALQKSLTIDPNNSPRWSRLANLQRKSQDLAGATRSLDSALKVDPLNDEARLTRGEVEQRLEHFEAALSDFDAYLVRHPNSANVERLKIDAARASLNHPVALAAIDAYLAIRPNDLTVLRARGDELYASGDEKAAISDWESYAVRMPNDADVLKSIAYASEHGGDFPKAVSVLTEYVRLRPSDDRLRLALAYDQARTGHPELATAAFTQLKDSSDPDVAAKANAELRARMTTTSTSISRSSRVAYGTVQYDSRFGDIVFGGDAYALGPAGRLQPYFTIHSWDDTRSSARAYEPIIYNDNSEILAGGLRLNLGSVGERYFFVESGEQISLIGRGSSPELRYGFASWSEAGRPGRGHTSFGFSVASYSRYGANIISYSNVLHDFPLASKIRGVIGTNFAFDTHREYWNNFGEIELGIKIGTPRLSFTLAGVDGVYLQRGALLPTKRSYTTFRPSLTWSPHL